ncbi:hypothetical protein F4782DRAFT_549204 [Xylaria castorea]|nr:hypothetical protein F4782DRAFT_549204 [Xylaria castorea]
MVDESPSEKRRRQNRDAQRRFRQRHSTQWSGSSQLGSSDVFQTWPPLSSSEALLQNDNSALFENTNDRAYAQYGMHHPLLPPNSWGPGERINPGETNLRGELYRPPQDCTRLNSNVTTNLRPMPMPMPIPPLDKFPEMSTNKNIGHQQLEPSSNSANRGARGRESSAIPPSAIDQPPSTELFRPTYPQRSYRSSSRTMSRAEWMITKVEQLYEVGLDIGILPEDPELLWSLNRMKMHFRSLVNDNFVDNLDDSVNSRLEDSSQGSGTD